MSEPDLRTITGFQWDHGNRSKSQAKHSVECREVEEMFLNDPLVAGIERSGEKRWAAYGQTDDGRFIAVVFTVRGTLLRPISSRSMSRKERKQYANETDNPAADEGGGEGTGGDEPGAGPEGELPESQTEPGTNRPSDTGPSLG